MRTVDYPRRSRSLFAALVSGSVALMATLAQAAEEPLRCQSAKLSAHVNHARCIVRCQRRPSEHLQACETRCDERLTRRLQILQSAAVCTGANSTPTANNDVCDLQLLKAAWKQVKCYLRCERLAENSSAFDSEHCQDNCSHKFDRTRARVLQQPACSQHSGQMPSSN